MGSSEEETAGSRTEGFPIVPAMLLMVMGTRRLFLAGADAQRVFPIR